MAHDPVHVVGIEGLVAALAHRQAIVPGAGLGRGPGEQSREQHDNRSDPFHGFPRYVLRAGRLLRSRQSDADAESPAADADASAAERWRGRRSLPGLCRLRLTSGSFAARTLRLTLLFFLA